MIAEVAMSMILLLGAGLLIRSFYLLERVQPGFDPTNVLTFQVQAPVVRYPTPADAARRTRMSLVLPSRGKFLCAYT